MSPLSLQKKSTFPKSWQNASMLYFDGVNILLGGKVAIIIISVERLPLIKTSLHIFFIIVSMILDIRNRICCSVLRYSEFEYIIEHGGGMDDNFPLTTFLFLSNDHCQRIHYSRGRILWDVWQKFTYMKDLNSFVF